MHDVYTRGAITGSLAAYMKGDVYNQGAITRSLAA